MAGHGYRTKLPKRIDDDNWREAVLLGLGHQIFKLADFDHALTVIHELLPEQPQDEPDWRHVLLLGEGYASLLTPQRAREAEGQKAAQHVMATAPRLLTAAMQNRDLPARQRLEAGLLLADLDVDPAGLDDFVPVPGAGISIGRYPVTNKQFQRFMDEGGYNLDKPWWTEKAVKEIKSYWGDEWVDGPRYWNNRRFDAPASRGRRQFVRGCGLLRLADGDAASYGRESRGAPAHRRRMATGHRPRNLSLGQELHSCQR